MPGSNVLPVLLGNGMYNVKKVAGRHSSFNSSFGPPKLIAELPLTYGDEDCDGNQWKPGGTVPFWTTRGGEPPSRWQAAAATSRPTSEWVDAEAQLASEPKMASWPRSEFQLTPVPRSPNKAGQPNVPKVSSPQLANPVLPSSDSFGSYKFSRRINVLLS